MATRPTLLAAAAISLGAIGCRPTMPSCDPDPLASDEASTPGFMLVPIVRAEAVNIFEAEWSPVLVATELYAGAPAAGATVGFATFHGEPSFVAGASVLRYSDGLRLFDTGADDGWRGSLLLPDVNARVHFVFVDPQPVLFSTFTTDLIGVRFARCLGSAACFQASLRAPTVGPAILFIEEDAVAVGDEPLGALVLGGALDLGFRF